jgi:hypothetical protein
MLLSAVEGEFKVGDVQRRGVVEELGGWGGWDAPDVNKSDLLALAQKRRPRDYANL